MAAWTKKGGAFAPLFFYDRTAGSRTSYAWSAGKGDRGRIVDDGWQNYGRVLTVGQVAATPAAWFAAIMIASLFVGATMLCVPHAAVMVSILPGFLPALASLTVLADILTAYVLWGQARAGEEPALVVLAATYCGTAVLVAVNAWVFPATFPVSARHVGHLAAWAWVFSHAFFALGAASYGLYPSSRGAPRSFRLSALGIVSVAGSLVAAAIVLAQSRYLPPLIAHGLFFRLPRLLSGLMPLVMAFAVVALVARRRVRTVLDTWLLVAMVGMWCDAALMNRGGGRFTAGWYGGHVISLAASLTVLMACLFEANWLYRRLVLREARMTTTNASLRAANSELATIAERDELTHLLNRRAILARLAERFAAWQGEGSAFSVLMVDLDHFKEINDEAGHLGGDEVLAQVALRLRAAVRASDAVGRYGGEEFIVVLPGTVGEGARKVGLKLIEVVRATPFGYKGLAMRMTVSVGGACVDKGDEDLDALIARADRALYVAKRDGRDRQAWMDASYPDDVCACG